MGLFDKLKGIVKGAQQAAQPQAPQHHASDDDDSNDDSDTSHSVEDADDWGGWDPRNHEEYWYRLKQIEKAGNDNGDDACDAKCREYGLRDYAHMQRVRETFHRHFAHLHEFQQAGFNANSRQAREDLANAAAANSEILAPVEGVDLRIYATVQARAAATGGDMAKWNQVLAENGMDQVKWDRVSAEWTRRMSGQAGDMNATMAVATEYSKYFGMAAQGQYGAAAAANAGQAGMLNHGQGAVGAEPCTMERYAEIMGAQSAWAQQGRDVNAMLQSQFNMNALDFSNLGQYWSAKIGGDYRIAIQIGDLQTHYEQQYLAAGGGVRNDDDLSV